MALPFFVHHTTNDVIPRAVRPVGISWYHSSTCCAETHIVPGDCHVEASPLLAMTASVDFFIVKYFFSKY